ncbi:efflux RND transporter periplasmic adaptor subunit [uncultured Psychromonas sp.]|uniref:efflux RND transporter periplasmic adaptor subunit n=1 Tax=uncultured Psychromonas sp. TaxID=173974 RepID=UPI00262B4E1C|nr:efflux RND transporter periplasmic adaptor subunit [uncultured Psychromonas sp.]
MQTSEKKTSTMANEPVKKSKRKTSFFILFIVLVVIAATWFFYYEVYAKYSEETNDAYVNGDLVVISPQISGTVSKVVVDQGDYVEKGQILISLDSNDTQIALQAAEAKLANSVREVRSLYATADNAKASLEATKVEYNQAISDYKRRQKLAKSGAISQEDLNHYKDLVETTKSQYLASQQALKMAVALVDNTVLKTHPAIKSAVANLRQVYLNNLRADIVAPISGYVAKRAVQLGSQVQPGTQMMVIVPLHQVWVDANFKESQMRDMRIGQAVILTSDLYGKEVEYKGEIESLGIGTGSAFSLLPAQNASGNWIKIVQRLPVKIRLQKDNLAQYPLRIGLSMLAKVDIEDRNGALLSESPQQEARFDTDVYQNTLQEVDHLVTKILHENVGINNIIPE